MKSGLDLKITYPGEITVRTMELHSTNKQFVDIRYLYNELNIYEDIFTSFISGTITVRDSLAVLNKLPVVGEEILKLSLITPGLPPEKGYYIEGDFYVYKITDREYSANRMVNYTLHFISIEAMMDLNIKLSKGYNKAKISDIASDLLRSYTYFSNDNKEPTKEQLDRFNIEETSNGHAYVSNYWSPMKNLNYLTNFALSKPAEKDGKTTKGSPTYLFFENRNGLNFISLETLFRTDSIRTFTKNDYSRDIEKSGKTTFSRLDYETAYSNILDMNVMESFDYIERCREGAYASDLITYDLTTKVSNHINHTFDKNYKDEFRLNDNPPLSNKSIHTKENLHITLNKSTAIFDGNHDITNSKNIQRRTSMLKLLDSQRVEIEVLGRTDYTIGQKVELELYKISNLENEEEPLDKLLSGKYLITALRHVITTDTHNCVMELSKDSLVTNLDDGVPK